MIFRKVDEIWSGIRDALHVLARLLADVHKVHQAQVAMRATLDLVLLEMRKHSQESVGIAALLQAEVETEEEREQREKLEKEFAEVHALMQQIEEV